ncbi:MAG: ubiquinol-cytochrome C chaperone family protein [Alphaproteobacteria bacterium]
MYGRLVEQARWPGFYRDWGIPDTLDGRFEMIVLHVLLVLRRLRREGKEGSALGQVVFEVMIDDMDRSLREMGVGDLSVGRRVKAMAQAFYGRAAAYDMAIESDDDALGEALRRNVFGTVGPRPEQLAALVGYVRGEAAALDTWPASELLAGGVCFSRATAHDPAEKKDGQKET